MKEEVGRLELIMSLEDTGGPGMAEWFFQRVGKFSRAVTSCIFISTPILVATFNKSLSGGVNWNVDLSNAQ